MSDTSPVLLPLQFGATELRRWQRLHGYSDRTAASYVGLQLPAYRRQKHGKSRVTQQTAMLALYAPVIQNNWLEIAELAMKLHEKTKDLR